MAETKTIEINGHVLEVNEQARQSWELFDLICEIGTEFDQTKMPQAFKMIELCCGVDKAEFIEICGGKQAPYADVIANIVKVFAEIVPKN